MTLLLQPGKSLKKTFTENDQFKKTWLGAIAQLDISEGHKRADSSQMWPAYDTAKC